MMAILVSNAFRRPIKTRITYTVPCFGQSNMDCNKWNLTAPGPWPSANENRDARIVTYRDGTTYMAEPDKPGSVNDDGIGQAAAKFCKLLIDNGNAEKVWCLNRAVGGTRITASLPGQPSYDDCLADIRTLGLHPTYVLFSQGESDHDRGTDYWFDHFTTFRDAILSDYPSVRQIFLFQTADPIALTDPPSDTSLIVTAQVNSAAAHSKVTLIPMTDLDHTEGIHDGLHGNYLYYGPMGERAYAARAA